LAQSSWYSPVASSPVFTENPTGLSSQFATSRNGRFQFHKRSQLFIRSHNETFPVVAMRVCNKNGSPVAVQGCDAAPRPTGFAEIVSDDFPVLRGCGFAFAGSTPLPNHQILRVTPAMEACITNHVWSGRSDWFENMEIEYQPGDIAPRTSSLYRVVHYPPDPAMREHLETFYSGDHFPGCPECGKKVRYVLLAKLR
jgi:hypothetical protein